MSTPRKRVLIVVSSVWNVETVRNQKEQLEAAGINAQLLRDDEHLRVRDVIDEMSGRAAFVVAIGDTHRSHQMVNAAHAAKIPLVRTLDPDRSSISDIGRVVLGLMNP